MSDILRQAIEKATARIEPRRIAGIQRTTPGALGEPPRPREPIVSDWELQKHAEAEALDYKRHNLPIDWHAVESKTQAWQQAEQLRRIQERESALEKGQPAPNEV